MSAHTKSASTDTPPRSAGAVASASPAISTPAAQTAVAGLAAKVARSGRVILPIVGTAIVLAGELVEDAADSPPMQMLTPGGFVQRWLLVGFVAYLFGIWAIAERTVEHSLTSLRPAVRIDDEAFRRYERRMETMPIPIEIGLLLFSALISIGLFAILRADLLIDDPISHASRSLPPGLDGVVVLAGYTVLGWAFLRLVYGTARLARGLGDLAREPLRIDVFDTSDVLPFGNIALALALAPAGAIVILIVALGRPTTPVGWSVLVEATLAIVLGLLLPLRGVHRQMANAKHAAFSALSATVTDVYETVTTPTPAAPADWGRLSGTTGTVLQLRKAVQEMTTWPFRDTLAFSRALLIATAPLIYTTLSEIIKIIWIAPLTQP